MKACLSVFLPLLFLSLHLGCKTPSSYFIQTDTSANVYVDESSAKIRKIAIVTFKAPTELIGRTVSDLFATEILRTGEYIVLERSQLAAILGETELALGGVVESLVMGAAKKMGAEGVIFGTVDEYSEIAIKGRTYPVVAISVRMVDCGSGRILWSASIADKASSKKVSMGEHGRTVVHKLTAGLYKEWMKLEKKRTRVRLADADPASVVMVSDQINIAGISDDGLRQVTISWRQAGPKIRSLRVQRSTSPEGPFEDVRIVKAAAGSFVDKGGELQDDSIYYYALTPLLADSMPAAPAVVVKGKTAPPPEPACGLKVSAPRSRALRLDWDAPDSKGISQYIVERKTGEGFVELARVAKRSIVDDNSRGLTLDDSSEYFYRIRTVNRVNSISRPSEVVSGVTLPPPSEIEGLRMKESLVRAISLEWNIAEEKDIKEYKIYRADTEDGSYQCIGKTKGRETVSYIDGGGEPGNLKDNSGYWYKVTAVNIVGAESELCPAVKCVTCPPLPAPEDFKAQENLARSVLISWSKLEDEKLGGYVIRRKGQADESFKIICRPGKNDVSYLDTGGAKAGGLGELQDNTFYEYQIAAHDTGGYYENWSDTVSARTRELPEEPQSVYASTNLARRVQIQWDDIENDDIIGYEVQFAIEKKGEFAGVNASGLLCTNSTIVHKDLDDGQELFYRVRSVDKAGLVSDWSELEKGAARAAPPAPSEVMISEDGRFLVWDMPDGAQAEIFRVWRKKLLSAELHAEIKGERQYELIDADNSGRVQLSVSAVDADGLEGPRSEYVRVTGD